jgi:O-antigen/teichoic acid export membrane protein
MDESAARAFAARLSLKHPAVRATALNFGSFAVSQVFRLGSNLLLTRLLIPEAFGLMVIVHMVIQGLQMFSDLGLGPSIIQNKRGEEPAFLRTAWTVQIIRSIFVYAAAAWLAWPIASFYGNPDLRLVLQVTALNVILDAFCSAHVGVLHRRLEFGRLIAIDLGTYAIMIGVMVAGALVSQSVWPLVIGSLFGSALSSALTHVMLGGIRMRFQLDPEVLRQLYTFGRWIFVSTILTFLCSQLDRIVLGRFMTMTELGVYSIAFMFSQIMAQVVSEMSRSILFPIYSRSAEMGTEHLRTQTLRLRLALLALSLPPLWGLILVAPEFIEFLYDDRYIAAGWMLQLLGVGGIILCVIQPVEAVFLASGDSFRHMIIQFARLVTMSAAMAVGGYHYGATGIILGFVAASILHYPVLAIMVRRYRVWFPLLDLAAIAVSAMVVGGGLYLKVQWLGSM